ncbi:uncharacterized protein LOC111693417 [Trichogramma pretiosum]|uniref:uncharacterized protein LOC111693417 n=1 Tax=Trichogramma pretiosum TaxID=7493 RepID=UPI000C71C227|nr:uncharacterized protein LOC111693417 [Trichogramma pretiosum]
MDGSWFGGMKIQGMKKNIFSRGVYWSQPKPPKRGLARGWKRKRPDQRSNDDDDDVNDGQGDEECDVAVRYRRQRGEQQANDQAGPWCRLRNKRPRPTGLREDADEPRPSTSSRADTPPPPPPPPPSTRLAKQQQQASRWTGWSDCFDRQPVVVLYQPIGKEARGVSSSKASPGGAARCIPLASSSRSASLGSSQYSTRARFTTVSGGKRED